MARGLAASVKVPSGSSAHHSVRRGPGPKRGHVRACAPRATSRMTAHAESRQPAILHTGDMTMAGHPADPSQLTERSAVGSGLGVHQPVTWRAQWKVEKFHAGAADVRAGVYGSSAPGKTGLPVKPYEVIEKEGNLLTYGGADVLWLGLRDGLSATTGLANTRYNNANACIVVGDTNTAAAATQTDLAAPNTTTDRTFAGMEATYPTHTTGTAASTSSKIIFRSVFSTAIGNFPWEEWGIKNRVTANTGRLLNRKAESLGTKTSAATWTFTVTLSLA